MDSYRKIIKWNLIGAGGFLTLTLVAYILLWACSTPIPENLDQDVFLPMIFKEHSTFQGIVNAGAIAGAIALADQRDAQNEFEAPILIAIHSAVEARGVPDSNNRPGDPYNTNVKSWYVDTNGVDLFNEIGALGAIPATAAGVHIRIDGFDGVAVIP